MNPGRCSCRSPPPCRSEIGEHPVFQVQHPRHTGSDTRGHVINGAVTGLERGTLILVTHILLFQLGWCEPCLTQDPHDPLVVFSHGNSPPSGCTGGLPPTW